MRNIDEHINHAALIAALPPDVTVRTVHTLTGLMARTAQAVRSEDRACIVRRLVMLAGLARDEQVDRVFVARELENLIRELQS